MFSQRYTIIIVTFDSVARVDLVSDKSVRIVHSSCANRSTQAELGAAVRAGLNQGPKKCGTVYVLSDEFWSGHVVLADEIVDAVAADQLEQTLSLEAENLSGIAPFESRCGHAVVSSIGGKTTYWVTQAEAVQLNSIVAALPNWVGNIAGFCSIANSSSPPENTGDHSLDRTPSDLCSDLATAWLSKYLSGDSELAVIQMPSRSWTGKRQRQICVLVVISTLAICGEFHRNCIRDLASANVALSQLDMQQTRLQKDLDAGDKLASQIQDEKLQQVATEKAETQRLDQLRSKQFEYAAQRKRPVELLRALAATADSEHWIRNIDMNRTEVVLSGIGVDTKAVTSLAERLELELDSAMWLVSPAVMSITKSSRLIRFEMTLVPINIAAHQIAVGTTGAAHVR